LSAGRKYKRQIKVSRCVVTSKKERTNDNMAYWNIQTWYGGGNTGYFVQIQPGRTTVRGVKYELSRLTNIPVHQQRIVWAGPEGTPRILDDNLVLDEKMIQWMGRLVYVPSGAQQPGVRSLACAACGKLAECKCAGCDHTAYCSEKCQRGDWVQHRLVCKDL